MYEKLLKAITNLGSPNILLVGDFILDSYVHGDALRISPEAPVQVLKVVDRQYNCGGAGAVAANLAALGAKCTCIGVIGDDSNGKVLTELLDETNSDISGVLKLDDRPTISKQRLVGLAQHRHRQQLLRIDEESTEPLSDDDYAKLLQIYEKKLPNADLVCLQDYNKGILADKFCGKLIRMAQRAGKKVLIDPARTTDYRKYKDACLITPNRQETSTVVGFDINTHEDAAKAADILAKKLNLEAVVITLDRDGAFLQTKSSAQLIPTIPRNVYDVTGAGDTVLATLAISIAAGCEYRMAVQLANIAGGIEVSKFGVATVTNDEIVNDIIKNHRGKIGKIQPVDMLKNELNLHRQQNKSIVFTNGCFDVLHRGHIEYLKFCKAQGDIVVVGLNSDTSVKQIKGPSRPFNNQHDRAAVLAAFETVDYVVIFDEADPLNIIKQAEPNILVKGADWAKKGVIGREFVELSGGKVILAPLVDGKSSTATIEKIRSAIGQIDSARKEGQAQKPKHTTK